MKMKKMISAAAVILLSASFAFAQEEKPQTAESENAVQKVTSEAKKTRRKKVEMCSECGKPESECECHGHKKEGDKKPEQSGTAKGN